MHRQSLPAIFLVLLLYSCRKHHDAIHLSVESIPPILKAVTEKVNDNINGYYQALPAHYDTGSQRYPLLVFLHGGGGFGNGGSDLPHILEDGIPKLLDRQQFPAEFVVGGSHFSFIHLAPQFEIYPSSQDILSFIQYAIGHFRIDTNRIFIAGMSLGGRFACDAAVAYPTLFAAVVPMSGIPDTTGLAHKCSVIARSALPFWIFHNVGDQVFNIDLTKGFVGLINSYDPSVAPRFTIFSTTGVLGHDSWTRATDPDFRQDGMNIYEWMLQYRHN
jgi:predicted peptidase